jgi:hypothetical protein
MTASEKLSAVIEAQVACGSVAYDLLVLDKPTRLRGELLPTGNIEWQPSSEEPYEYVSVIQILLDLEGLKAAYPGFCGSVGDLNSIQSSDMYPFWKRVAPMILESWLSGRADAAIDNRI